MHQWIWTAAFVAAVAACTVVDEAHDANSEVPSPDATELNGYVEVNSLSYYYEMLGIGEPLLLLHGGLGSTDMFDPVLPILAQHRRVIGVDLHGHGRTALGDRAISLIAIGDDLAALVQKLGFGQIDVLGYSFGSGAAFRLAVQHPALVRRLALVSAAFEKDGYYPDILAQQAQVNAGAAEMLRGTPMYETYAALAPYPEDFPRLLDQMGNLMREPYDWSADVAKLTMPVLLMYGDSDMFRPEHIVEFYQLLGGGLRDAGWERENMSRNRLAILPDLTHYEIFMAPEMAHTAVRFLDGVTQPPAWTGP